jgi:peptidyl-tRNA hydrolase
VKPARYIFLNKGLGMSPGKCAAQAGHAETLAMHEFFSGEGVPGTWIDEQRHLYDKWFGYGHYAKYVMQAEDSTQMHTIKHYLEERGFRCYLVVDEGHTEGTHFVPTAMSVELVDKDDERTASIFGEFRRYKVTAPTPDPRATKHRLAGFQRLYKLLSE